MPPIQGNPLNPSTNPTVNINLVKLPELSDPHTLAMHTMSTATIVQPPVSEETKNEVNKTLIQMATGMQGINDGEISMLQKILLQALKNNN